MTRHPSWSTMRTSSGDGGWQKRCLKNCKIDSVVLGTDLRATATCPRAKTVFLEIRLDSLCQS